MIKTNFCAGTNTHTHMVLTTQHAVKHCKMTLLPPADSTTESRNSTLENFKIETQQQFRFSRIEVYFIRLNSLLFVLHSFVRVPFILFKITSNSCVHCFCLFLVFFFFPIQFIIICLRLSHVLFSLYAVG